MMAVYLLQKDWCAPVGDDLYWEPDRGQTRSVLAGMTGPIGAFAVTGKPGDTFVVQIATRITRR